MSDEFGGPAVVLRKVDYGDSDAVITFLTRDHGRVGAFVKGARRRRNPRFQGCLEPFTVVQARFRRRSAGADLLSLTVCDVTDAHAGLRRDFARIAWASYAAEVTREFAHEGDDAGVLFRIFTGRLTGLGDPNRHPGDHPEDQAAFDLAVLAAAGFAPRLGGCGVCGRPLAPPPPPPVRWTLSPRGGGLVCDPCTATALGGSPFRAPMSAGAALSLRAAAGVIPPNTPRVRFDDPTLRAELQGVLPDYIEATLDKALKTRAFLASTGLT